MTNAFPLADEAWAAFEFLITTNYTGTRDGPAIVSANGTKLAWMRMDGNGTQNRWTLYGPGVAAVTSFGDAVVGTHYWGWMRYKKGTGADAITTLYIATSGTRPGTPTLNHVTGTSTLQANGFNVFEEEWTSYWDDIRVRTDGTTIDD
jgi:hypothetical protein